MISEFLQATHRFDASIQRVLGRPYHMVLGAGLVVELVERFKQLREAGASTTGVVHLTLVVLLYLALLVHQFGELHTHMKEVHERRAT